jgi:Flp pilus assembly pilin Flp
MTEQLNLVHFCSDEQGQSALEYDLILGLVVITAAVILVGLGKDIAAIFQTLLDLFPEPAKTQPGVWRPDGNPAPLFGCPVATVC